MHRGERDDYSSIRRLVFEYFARLGLSNKGLDNATPWAHVACASLCRAWSRSDAVCVIVSAAPGWLRASYGHGLMRMCLWAGRSGERAARRELRVRRVPRTRPAIMTKTTKPKKFAWTALQFTLEPTQQIGHLQNSKEVDR